MTFPTLKDIKQQLHTDAYVRLPFTTPEGVIENTRDTFLAFTRLPIEVKEKFRVVTPKGENKCNEVGYKHYNIYDSKPADIDWFHYNPLIYTRMEEQKKGGEEADAMLSAMHALYEEACTMFGNVVESLEEGYPNIRSQLYEDGSPYPKYAGIRFIRYGRSVPHPKTHLYFTAHFDSGGCTLPLAQSGPGLLIGRTLESMKPLPVEKGVANMFPGLNWYKITDDDFAPSLHVVDPDLNQVVADDVARWVAIFFVDHNEFKKCDVCEKTHW